MLTQIYVRTKRDGKFDNYDITELTEDELQAFLSMKTKEELIRWFFTLTKVVRDIN